MEGGHREPDVKFCWYVFYLSYGKVKLERHFPNHKHSEFTQLGQQYLKAKCATWILRS